MKKFNIALALVAGLISSGACQAQARVGQAAPAFTATDATGKTVSLADYRGKFVVLEWLNPQCPFTQKHYATGNMAATQQHAASKGAVWLSINTSTDAGAANAVSSFIKTKGATPTAVLHDAGKIARSYGAKTTPHLYLIDPAGTLAYAGAIDSKASADPADIPGAINYVSKALDEATAGKPVSTPVTKSYGCAVKYSLAD